MISESVGDFIPRGYKIIAAACCHENGRLHHITDRGAAFLQRDTQVLKRPPRLRYDITGRDDVPVIAQRAGSRGEDQVRHASLRSVRVRNAWKEPRAANEFNRHDDAVCQPRAGPGPPPRPRRPGMGGTPIPDSAMGGTPIYARLPK